MKIPQQGAPLSIPCGDGTVAIAETVTVKRYSSFDVRVLARVTSVFPHPSALTDRVARLALDVGIPMADLHFTPARQTWDVSPRFATWCWWTTRKPT